MSLDFNVPTIIIVAGAIFILVAIMESINTDKFGFKVLSQARIFCLSFGFFLLSLGILSARIIEPSFKGIIIVISLFILAFVSCPLLVWLTSKINKKILEVVIFFASIILISSIVSNSIIGFHHMTANYTTTPLINNNNNINITNNNSNNIQLNSTTTPTLATGNILVASSPSGASVYLDGVYKGITPINLNNVEQGSHTISLKLEDYEDWSETVSIDAGKTITKLADLESIEIPTSISPTSKTSFISIDSSPSGASISLDGAYEGETPKILNDIEQGSHIITLKLAGYEDWSQTINVDAGKTLSLSPTLKPNPSVEIKKIWFNYDIFKNNLKGMETYVNFNTYNLKSEDCVVTEYFYFSNGVQLQGFDTDYSTSDGYLAASNSCTQLYDPDYNTKFPIFIPYNAFYLKPGTYDMKFYIEIQSEGKLLATSDWYPITITQY